MLKPSERTPILANQLAELFSEAGVSPGVLNIVHGAHVVVNGLLGHTDLVAISFVGSQPVAKYVYERASANGKRVQALSGAKDLDEGLDFIQKSKYGNGSTIYTFNAKVIRQFREEADAGMLGINVGVPATMAFFPFSGWKDSFYGEIHVNGKDCVNFYTRKKMITSRFEA